MFAMSTQPKPDRPIQAAQYVGYRLPDGTISYPLPPGDRVRMHDPTGRAPWIEWSWRDHHVGYGPAEDD